MKEQIEKRNFEDFIMDNLLWTKEQKMFLGSLIYNLEDANGDDISTVICKRTSNQFSIQYIYPNESAENATEFSLVFDKQKMDIDYSQTTNNVVDFNEAKLFVLSMNHLINQTVPTFYPSERINQLSSDLKDKNNNP